MAARRVEGHGRAPERRPRPLWSGRWRWYRSRLGGPAALLAIGGTLFLVAALRPDPPWYERARPSPGPGLTRLSGPWPGGFFRQLSLEPAAGDVRDSVLVAHDGTSLVGERLYRYADAAQAKLALGDVLRRNGAGDAVPGQRLHHLRAGCTRGCRPVVVLRDVDVVVVLGRLIAPGEADAARAQASLTAVADRYAEQLVGEFEVDVAWRPGELLRILAALAFFYVPFAARQAWVTRRAPRTPHRHVPGEVAAAGVADVCDAAGAARRRAHRVLAVQFGIVAACALLIAVYVPLILVAMLAAPLGWLWVRRAYVARPRPVVRPGASALDRRRVGVVRSVRVRVEIVAARLGAAVVSSAAWLIGFVGMLLVGAAGRVLAEGGLSSGFFEDRHPVVEIEIAAALFLLFGFLAAGSPLGRFARRLRVAAADREQEHGRRPSVLYLRTFEDDHRLLAAGGPEGRTANEVLTFRSRVPYEEVVVGELHRHGAVAAVAEPGTPRLFLPLGAPRKRLSDAGWREAVAVRMRDATLIVIAVGSTQGLLWELEAATRHDHLDRVLLIVPPDDDAAIRARWHATAAAIAGAGGPVLEVPVDPASILVAQLGTGGVGQAVVADRRDEHTYVAALERALGVAGESPVPAPDRSSEPVQARSGPLGALRGVGFAIALTFLTVGLYSLYWTYTTHEELKRHTGSGLGGELGVATFLATFGASTAFVIPSEIRAMYRSTGRKPPVGPWTGLWLVPGFVAIVPVLVWFLKVQSALNSYWTAEGATRGERLPDSSAGTRTLGRRRGIGFGIALFLVTGPLYAGYWVYKTHDELKRHAGEGLGGVDALVLGAVTIMVVNAFVLPIEIGKTYARAGRVPPIGRWTGLWLIPGGLFLVPGIVWFVRVQRALNDYWEPSVSANEKPV